MIHPHAMEAPMPHRPKSALAVLLIAAALLALAGCLPGASPLDGTRWRLIQWTISSIEPADVTITAQFARGRISGSSGVNTYSGASRVGPGDALAVGPLASTEMGGPEPMMRAEGAYATMLTQAKSFKVADGRLTLYDTGGNESLIFEAVGR